MLLLTFDVLYDISYCTAGGESVEQFSTFSLFTWPHLHAGWGEGGAGRILNRHVNSRRSRGCAQVLRIPPNPECFYGLTG